MSDIAAIQTNAAGVTTFEKVEWTEVKEPVSAARSSKPAGACHASDAINFSQPMRKNLEAKKSYFQQAPSQAEQLRQSQRDAHSAFEIVS